VESQIQATGFEAQKKTLMLYSIKRIMEA